MNDNEEIKVLVLNMLNLSYSNIINKVDVILKSNDFNIPDYIRGVNVNNIVSKIIITEMLKHEASKIKFIDSKYERALKMKFRKLIK
jgi:hypothetical protein